MVCPYLYVQDGVSVQLCIFLILSSHSPCDEAWIRLPSFPTIVLPPTPRVSTPTLLAAVPTPFAETNRPARQTLQISILMPIWASLWPCPSGPCRTHHCGEHKAEYIHCWMHRVSFRLAQEHRQRRPPSSDARAALFGAKVLRNAPSPPFSYLLSFAGRF